MGNQKTSDAVAVIIVVHNRLDDLEVCLGSVENAVRSKDKVLVFENHSEDQKTLQRIRSRYTRFHWRCSEVNLGFAGANNIGVRWALSQDVAYVYLLNPDTIVPKNVFQQLVEASKTLGDRSILTPLLICPRDGNRVRIDSAGLRVDRFYRSLDDCQGLYLDETPLQDTTVPVRIWGICGASIWIPAALFPLRNDHKGSIFRDDFFAYSEDFEFSWYWRKAKGSMYLIPWLQIAHNRQGGSRVRKISLQSWYTSKDIIEKMILNRYKTIASHESLLGFLRKLPFFLPYETARWLYILVFKPYLWRTFFKSFWVAYQQVKLRK